MWSILVTLVERRALRRIDFSSTAFLSYAAVEVSEDETALAAVAKNAQR